MGKVKVLILPDTLREVLGFSEMEVEISNGKYKFKDIIEILKQKIPKLVEILETKTINRELFIAIDGRVFYDLNHEIEIKDQSRISLFTVGAGG